MNIFLIRHGRQSSSDCNVNVPLSIEGKRQAQLLGKRMQNYPIDALYTSDLIRAKQTGEIAFANQKEIIDNMQVRSELAEIDFGSLTGSKDEVVKKFYQEYYEKQQQLFSEKLKNLSKKQNSVEYFVGNYFIPVEDMWYPDGENGAMVIKRVMPVLKEMITSKHENIAVVSHGGLIRILLCVLFGGDFSKRLQFGSSLENCSITQIHYDKKLNSFFLERFNDYAHIESEPDLLRHNFIASNSK